MLAITRCLQPMLAQRTTTQKHAQWVLVNFLIYTPEKTPKTLGEGHKVLLKQTDYI